jgi:hypothetical protein
MVGLVVDRIPVDLVVVVDTVVVPALQNFQYLDLRSLPKNHRARNYLIAYKCFLLLKIDSSKKTGY